MAKDRNYWQNIAKEINDVYHAYQRRVEMSNSIAPGSDTEANRLRRIEDRQVGQMVGAILQGRRYDAKGRQIKK